MCKSKKPGPQKPMKKNLVAGTAKPFEPSVVVKQSAFSQGKKKEKPFKQIDGNSHHHEQKVVSSGVF